MSRRKQARPIRLHEDDENAPPADLPATVLDGQALPQTLPKILMCQRCQEQFTDVQEYLTHKAECERKAAKHDDPAHSDPEDMVVSEDDEDDETGGKRLERMRRHRQDAANNNSVEENSPDETTQQLDFEFPPPAPPGHVTLEALQNTKVAVAQFAATAMANNPDNEVAIQELAVLQSTLFTLQHQQVLQLQLINQLQHQLQIDRPKTEDGSPNMSPRSETDIEADTNIEPERSTTPLPKEKSREASPVPKIDTPVSQPLHSTTLSEIPKVTCAPSLPPQIQPPMCSISSSLASTIITHNTEPPSMDAPNTLEMLQKRAQEVLDNASQGLLATNLADELAFRKSKGSMSPYDSKGRNEPFFKHRCRYCGKVFGSDSALQIHIRSHTGERPYKCNVCGSRFTTKGNLKVHFQRHSQKFPHIKMNPNPVPEHLDKYHPPLLAQLGQQSALSPGGPPHPPHLGFPGGPQFPPNHMSLYRPPIHPQEMITNRLQASPHRPPELRPFPPHPMFVKREEQDAPENLSKPPRSPTPTQASNLESTEKNEVDDRMHANVPSVTPKQELSDIDNDNEQGNVRYPSASPVQFDECSMDSKYSNENMSEQRSPGADHSENMQDEPENLSNRSNSITIPLSIATGQRLPANFSFGHVGSPPSSTSSGSLGHFPMNPMDITKDPAIYTNLLPRPGSNDNSWESLIEVTKTSETSKLQQLVDNIEHKLSDPNQCVICHRVLSCKSALQMHYRTHTGERPFRCKICGRAFTTKGNLKTHMGVHRAKPPMRVLHQCPVCHKKFTNALVLQQHIRLHTGEPTDLTPEQIQAAEIKDFPSPGGFPPMHPLFGQGFPVSGLSPLGPGGMPYMKFDTKSEIDGRSEQESMDEDDEDDEEMSNYDQHNLLSPPSDMHGQGAPNPMASNLCDDLSYSAEDLCSNRTTHSTSPPVQNGEKSPSRSEENSPRSGDVNSSPNNLSTTSAQNVPRPPSSQQAGSPTPSDCNSLGALDLTPRSNQPLITSPGPSPGPPPSLFSAFGIMPPNQASTPLMSSALSSLTSSVLTSTAFSPLRLAVGPPDYPLVAGRGNTTCNLCFKTFACHSALEIHYRSHTKERPFKCTVCDRGFSTKGNMKQHMLTHKIRDMPQHMFDNKPPGSVGSSSADEPLPPSPIHIPTPRDTSTPSTPLSSVKQETIPTPPIVTEPPHPSINEMPPFKREPTEAELPLPKRPPSLQASKHLCHVCNKNFSSSSALQIHMRTHTGDKPFRCTVCQKAFTTKGNLKVHMGTHMWSNGASRRGRRMSLDLPPIPMTPKDSEFLQRRPDLFYPYLPAPFLNGMQQKLNELSSVQNNQNGLAGAAKFGGILNFGYPPPESLRSQGASPERPERPSSRETESRGLWDLHFERKNAGEPPREELLPASREGLAA